MGIDGYLQVFFVCDVARFLIKPNSEVPQGMMELPDKRRAILYCICIYVLIGEFSFNICGCKWTGSR